MQVQGNRIFLSEMFSSSHQHLTEKSHSIRRYSFLPGLFLCLGRKARVLRVDRKWCFVNRRSARDFHIRYQLAKRKAFKGQDLNEVMQRLYDNMRDLRHEKAGLYAYLRGSYRFEKGRFVENVEQAPLAMTDRYQGSFYKLQKEGKTVGYLLGTMHAGKKSFYPLPYKMMRSAFKSSRIYFEVVFNQREAEDVATARKKAFVEAEKRPEVRKAAKKRNALYDSYSSIFFMTIFGLITGLHLKYGIEKSVVRIIKKYDSKKGPFKGLEAVSDRIHLFRQIADHLEEIVEDEKAQKKNSSFSFKKIQNKPRKTVQKFLNGDEKREFSREDQFMLIDRNHGMVKAGIKAIDQGQKGQRVFMAVGNSHLAGPEGMHELFRKEGLTVIRK